jgi:hypothetical protein
MEYGADQEQPPGGRRRTLKPPALSKILRDCLPCFYLTGAFAAFFATLYIGAWYWILPHSVLIFAACLHLAIAFGGRHQTAGNSKPG